LFILRVKRFTKFLKRLKLTDIREVLEKFFVKGVVRFHSQESFPGFLKLNKILLKT